MRRLKNGWMVVFIVASWWVDALLELLLEVDVANELERR